MAEITNEELLIHLHYLREAADRTNAHLQAQNGRIRTAEDAILVLKTEQAVAQRQAQNSGRTAGAIAGSVISGLVMAAYKIFGGPQ